MELLIVDLTDQLLTDTDIIELYTELASPYSIVLLKGIERAVQHRTMHNKKMTCAFISFLFPVFGPYSVPVMLLFRPCASFDPVLLN